MPPVIKLDGKIFKSKDDLDEFYLDLFDKEDIDIDCIYACISISRFKTCYSPSLKEYAKYFLDCFCQEVYKDPYCWEPKSDKSEAEIIQKMVSLYS